MIEVDDKGMIKLYQGDSGDITIEGLSTEYNYQVYFAIQNSRRQPMGQEIMTESNFNDSVVITLTANLTDKLTVPINKESEDYFYGIKACRADSEDTLFLDGGYFGSKNIMKVYPKKVEGIR